MCDSVERYLNLYDIQQFTVKESISLKDTEKECICHIYSDQNMITSIPDIYANREISPLQIVPLRVNLRQTTCKSYSHQGIFPNIITGTKIQICVWYLTHVINVSEFVKGKNLAISLFCYFWYILFVLIM